ncbi:hypothetical protein QJS10_CPB12g00743 [Acorus calamus]|uniref:RRM domain-containing protein n=1 Tax=Acorus calamus TaxID=4465 RepID=A0AAV9DP00_ACOCL|nr:hypothetical protein QJS10_CPB12g00743 [Acorus calamus]
MAVITENRTEDQQFGNGRPSDEKEMQNLVDLLSKLNPLAEEFVPSSYVARRQSNVGGGGGLSADAPVFTSFAVSNAGFNDNEKPHRRRKNNHNEGKRRLNGRSFRAQREDSIRRTIYVSDIDQTVVDCRICGDPHSHLRFAFVEFADQQGARAALNLSGTMLGFHPLKVLPSKTAILPVNPTFLPKSENEREMCTRTIYCTNIDKKVSQADLKVFFESSCGEVSRLRLLGDHVHSTRIAFVEFLSVRIKDMAYYIAEFNQVISRIDLQETVRRAGQTANRVWTQQTGPAAIEAGQQQQSLESSKQWLAIVNKAWTATTGVGQTANSALRALNISGKLLGNEQIRVSPSKTPVRVRGPQEMLN